MISPDAAGFVLAGGRSSRMGSDKAQIRLGGRTLLDHALGILRSAGLSASIAGWIVPGETDAPVVPDDEPDQGPLSGVCAAFRSSDAQYAVFLSVDMPFVPASLIQYSLHHARVTSAAVTIAADAGRAQTFPAVVDRTLLPELEAALKGSERGCLAVFRAAARQNGHLFAVLPVELLAQSGQVFHVAGLPACRWFHNVNTPEDLLEADSLMDTHRVI